MENMDNNDGYRSQGFAPDDGGYTKAPDSGNQTYNQQSGPQFNNQYFDGQGGNMPQQEGSKGFAIAGMVLGIISIVCCCSWYIGGICGIVGLVLSIIALVKKLPGRGMAIAGVICSVIGLLFVVCVLLAMALYIPDGVHNSEELQRYLEDILDEQTHH